MTVDGLWVKLTHNRKEKAYDQTLESWHSLLVPMAPGWMDSTTASVEYPPPRKMEPCLEGTSSYLSGWSRNYGLSTYGIQQPTRRKTMETRGCRSIQWSNQIRWASKRSHPHDRLWHQANCGMRRVWHHSAYGMHDRPLDGGVKAHNHPQEFWVKNIAGLGLKMPLFSLRLTYLSWYNNRSRIGALCALGCALDWTGRGMCV